MENHTHECPGEPNKGRIITIAATEPHSAIWCLSCPGWESIPKIWHKREQELRNNIEMEWSSIRRDNKRIFQSIRLTTLISDYCFHRGWRVPDFEDRYDIFRIMRRLKEEAPWVSGHTPTE
jgi:hypothetical protein